MMQAGLDRFRQVATIERGGLSESWHFGAAAVVDAGGRLVARAGSEAVETFVRSAAKPFQALPLVLGGGVERWSLSRADLALICASHQGTPAHTERAASLLDRAGLAVEALGCGPHWPYDEASREALRRAGREPTRLHNNCSGKHAGMLLACRMLGYPIEGYLDPDHPLQQRIHTLVAERCRVELEEVGQAVDGCGAPSYRLSLEALARGYAVLADPVAAGVSEELAAALATIVAAMTAVPEMVAGPGTFTTRLIEVTGGRVLGKEGAEGLYAVAVRGPVTLGVAVKIADGGERARPGVVMDILRQMGALSAAELEALHEFHRPAVLNALGDAVGAIVPGVELDEA
jgi:L-asparaginase II